MVLLKKLLNRATPKECFSCFECFCPQTLVLPFQREKLGPIFCLIFSAKLYHDSQAVTKVSNGIKKWIEFFSQYCLSGYTWVKYIFDICLKLIKVVLAKHCCTSNRHSGKQILQLILSHGNTMTKLNSDVIWNIKAQALSPYKMFLLFETICIRCRKNFIY